MTVATTAMIMANTMMVHQEAKLGCAFAIGQVGTGERYHVMSSHQTIELAPLSVIAFCKLDMWFFQSYERAPSPMGARRKEMGVASGSEKELVRSMMELSESLSKPLWSGSVAVNCDCRLIAAARQRGIGAAFTWLKPFGHFADLSLERVCKEHLHFAGWHGTVMLSLMISLVGWRWRRLVELSHVRRDGIIKSCSGWFVCKVPMLRGVSSE